MVAGRQEPVNGSKRDRRMQMVKAYLLAHPSGGTYADIGTALGLHPETVQYTVGDIQRFDPDLVVAVPTERSGWRTSIRWRDIMHGQVNQAKHLKTRLESQANALRKMATSGKFPPYIAQMFRAAAVNAEAQAIQQAANIGMYEAAKSHATTGTSGP
jgi:hypothetical protein